MKVKVGDKVAVCTTQWLWRDGVIHTGTVTDIFPDSVYPDSEKNAVFKIRWDHKILGLFSKESFELGSKIFGVQPQ